VDTGALYAVIEKRTEALRKLCELMQKQCCNQGQPNYLESNDGVQVIDGNGQNNPFQSETDYSL
jgi:hypothetical protein